MTKSRKKQQTKKSPPIVDAPSLATKSPVRPKVTSHNPVESAKPKKTAEKVAQKPNRKGPRAKPAALAKPSTKSKVSSAPPPPTKDDKLKESINHHHMETIQAFTSLLSHEGQMVDRGNEVVSDQDVVDYAEELDGVLNQKEALLLKMKSLIGEYPRRFQASSKA